MRGETAKGVCFGGINTLISKGKMVLRAGLMTVVMMVVVKIAEVMMVVMVMVEDVEVNDCEDGGGEGDEVAFSSSYLFGV